MARFSARKPGLFVNFVLCHSFIFTSIPSIPFWMVFLLFPNFSTERRKWECPLLQ